MATFEVIYWHQYCDNGCPEFKERCFAEDREDDMSDECDSYYGTSEMEEKPKYARYPHIVRYGRCFWAKYKEIRQGFTAKEYRCEIIEDFPNRYMQVETKKHLLDCWKVVIDGKCIFNEYDEQPEEGTGNPSATEDEAERRST